MAASGWPGTADLAKWLGDVADDELVAAALAAAVADAVEVAELDPVEGVSDAGQWVAVLNLGAWWYQSRNRPDGPDAMYPSSSPYGRRVYLAILRRGTVVIG